MTIPQASEQIAKQIAAKLFTAPVGFSKAERLVLKFPDGQRSAGAWSWSERAVAGKIADMIPAEPIVKTASILAMNPAEWERLNATLAEIEKLARKHAHVGRNVATHELARQIAKIIERSRAGR